MHKDTREIVELAVIVLLVWFLFGGDKLIFGR